MVEELSYDTVYALLLVAPTQLPLASPLASPETASSSL